MKKRHFSVRLSEELLEQVNTIALRKNSNASRVIEEALLEVIPATAKSATCRIRKYSNNNGKIELLCRTSIPEFGIVERWSELVDAKEVEGKIFDLLNQAKHWTKTKFGTQDLRVVIDDEPYPC